MASPDYPVLSVDSRLADSSHSWTHIQDKRRFQGGNPRCWQARAKWNHSAEMEGGKQMTREGSEKERPEVSLLKLSETK
ncbi:hypothetical protein GOODEAATRI_005315 [Goodea atripinnis]|uniref:Uncharacterized protein n=1 Tax=Goodea atripinnis TaxID=208336 RepID=A0ABV0N939_9TELE